MQRTAYPEVPPRVEYRLTPLGAEVAERVGDLVDWLEGSVPPPAPSFEPEVAHALRREQRPQERQIVRCAWWRSAALFPVACPELSTELLRLRPPHRPPNAS